MIIVSLSGGPGNQLFQYAIGVKLSSQRNQKLVLDYGWYTTAGATKVEPRQYILPELLEIDSRITQVNKLSGRAIRNSFHMVAAVKAFYGMQRFYKNCPEARPFLFDAKLGNGYKHVFLNGYWQAYQYTVGVEMNIRAAIESAVVRAADPEIMRILQKRNTVCISVRKGSDYLGSLSVCGVGYFIGALCSIAKEIGCLMRDLNVLVFSDNLNWCRQNFSDFSCNLTFVDSEKMAAPGIEKWKIDLILGSMCKNHIISNSSFSWWVARLSEARYFQSRVLVVAPSLWWNGLNTASLDVVSPHWFIHS